jgi:hypothetical protein
LLGGRGSGVSLEWEAPLLLGIVISAITGLVLSYIGDAAVYFGPSPQNIEARHKIRAHGLKLLKALNANPRYDRIVVVGHSLGSVVGYDVIALCWQQLLDEWRDGFRAQCDAGTRPVNTEKQMIASEVLAARSTSNFEQPDWEAMARSVRAEICGNGYNWKISDLITLGSPLTYGEFLLASGREDFARRKAQRELATAPPTSEPDTKTGQPRHSYLQWITDVHGQDHWFRVPHHAAQFAATAWTNIYYKGFGPIGSDLIGGPLAGQFGAGVKDVPVWNTIWLGLLSHIRYWQQPGPLESNTALAALAVALDLERRK